MKMKESLNARLNNGLPINQREGQADSSDSFNSEEERTMELKDIEARAKKAESLKFRRKMIEIERTN